MPGLEWLIIKEGGTKGNPTKFQEFTHNNYLIKNNARYLLAGRCQDDFKVGCALCQCDRCKSAKMRVG